MRQGPRDGRRRRTSARRECGAAAVEFALVLPLLVLLVGGIIDFGFVFAQQITFNSAVRDAARAGVVPTFSNTTLTCQQIATQTRAGIGNGALGVNGSETPKIVVTVVGPGTPSGGCVMASGSTTASNGTVKPCAGATETDQNLSVSVRYASKPPFPVPFKSDFDLRSTGTFQCEYS